MVSTVVVVTVLRVLVFVLDEITLRECEVDGNAGVGEDGGCVVTMSADREYVGSKRGSCIVSSAADILEMSVLRWMAGVGGVCEMCLGLGGGWIRGLDLGYITPVGTGGCSIVSMCLGYRGVGDVCLEWERGVGTGSGSGSGLVFYEEPCQPTSGSA